MKWPNTLAIVRHGESGYNGLGPLKAADVEYQEFRDLFDTGADPQRALELATSIYESGRFQLPYGDHDTPLTNEGRRQSLVVGGRLRELIPLPDIVYVSPYDRTRQTHEGLTMGWPELAGVPVVSEERIREQDHGLALLYNDRRIFMTLHPEQKALYQKEGQYWYRYPQGENIPDVRDRHRSVLDLLIREHSGMNVLMVAHHISLLSQVANLGRMDAEGFLRLNREQRPINCGLTVFKGDPEQGKDGKLVLDVYNRKLY